MPSLQEIAARCDTLRRCEKCQTPSFLPAGPQLTSCSTYVLLRRDDVVKYVRRNVRRNYAIRQLLRWETPDDVAADVIPQDQDPAT